MIFNGVDVRHDAQFGWFPLDGQIYTLDGDTFQVWDQKLFLSVVGAIQRGLDRAWEILNG